MKYPPPVCQFFCLFIFLFLHNRLWNFFTFTMKSCFHVVPWCRGVVIITTVQLHSTQPELKFCAGSNPTRGVSENRDGEDL